MAAAAASAIACFACGATALRRCRRPTDLVAAACGTCGQHFPSAVLDAADIARLPYLDADAEEALLRRVTDAARTDIEDRELAELLAAVGEDDVLVAQVLESETARHRAASGASSSSPATGRASASPAVAAPAPAAAARPMTTTTRASTPGGGGGGGGGGGAKGGAAAVAAPPSARAPAPAPPPLARSTSTPMTVAGVLEELSCPVCMEQFGDAIVLRCGHSLCKRCSADCCARARSGSAAHGCLVGGAVTMNCPTCRVPTPDAEGLRPSLTLAFVVRALGRIEAVASSSAAAAVRAAAAGGSSSGGGGGSGGGAVG